MTIFFTASYYGKEKYQKYYDMVRMAIEATKVKLISPETGNYLSVLTQREKQELGNTRRIHYEAIKRGIQLSDAVIIEISHEDFQLGHEATLAIQNRKHVLCLSLFENFQEKIENRYFHAAQYNEYTIEEIIEAFIAKAKKEHLNERFNMFLSSSQVEFLKKEAKRQRVTTSEVIRRLIDDTRI